MIDFAEPGQKSLPFCMNLSFCYDLNICAVVLSCIRAQGVLKMDFVK